MKRRKRRKVNVQRLLILACIPVLCIGGIGWGIHHFFDQREQNARWQLVQSIEKEHNKVRKEIKKMETSDYVDEDDFESLRELALKEDYDNFALLDNYGKEQVRIDDESFEKIEALKQPKKEKYYRLMKMVDEMDDEGGSYVRFVLQEPKSRIDYALEFENRDKYKKPSRTIEKDLDEVPHLIQWDTKWGFVPYGDMRISFSGCAPTCLSMVISYLNQDDEITPAVLAEYSEESGYYVEGVGTSHALLDAAASDYNIDVEGVMLDEESLTAALKDGKICIASVRPGDFTTVGHFIVISGIKDGKLEVKDPNSKIRTKKLWDIDRVLDQTNAIWAYSKG